MKANRAALIGITAVVVVVLAIDFLSGGMVRNFVRSTGSIVFRWGSSAVSSIENTGGLSSRASLARENAALREQIAQLQGQNVAAAAAKAQLAELSAMVHLAQTAPGITAAVTSSFRASPYGTFTIGAGSSDGVVPNAMVESPDGYVIGRVSEVSSHQALVAEFFAPRQQVDALISGIPVALTGQGGGAASGDGPRGASISVGDVVFAPAFGGRPIGVVGEVKAGAASAATNVLVRTPANLTSLTYVYVESTKRQ